MSDLDKLIEAVDGGGEAHVVQIFAKRILSAAVDRGNYWPSHDVDKAFRGSLDAARALHEALLPGWSWVVDTNYAAVMDHDGSDDLRDLKYFQNDNPNPARAWLLSILKAYRSQQC